MADKTKLIIIIALAGILAVSLFVNLQIAGSKKAIEKELEYAKTENASLNKKIEESLKDNKQLEERINALNSDLNRISQEKGELEKQKENFQKEKEELQKQYDAVLKERDDLKEKLKMQPALREAPKESASAEDSYWSGILRAKTDLELQLKTVQTNNEQLKIEKEALGLELNNLTHEKQDLEQQLQYRQKMLDGMASESVQDKNARFQLQDKLSSLKAENTILRRQLRSLSTSKVKLAKKLGQLDEEKSRLERTLAAMEIYLKEKAFNINEARQQLERITSGEGQGKPQPKKEPRELPQKESVELPPIIVRPQGEKATLQNRTAETLSFGSILAVNRDNNFVIIDVGEDSGVKAGEAFQVYRQGEVIATIEVIQPRKNISACDIKKQTLPIQVGDAIK